MVIVKSNTISFTVPKELKIKLDAISHTGYYDSLSEFLRDAIRNILKERKDLRIAMAYELYKSEKISIGKAAEILELSMAEIREIFKEREI